MPRSVQTRQLDAVLALHAPIRDRRAACPCRCLPRAASWRRWAVAARVSGSPCQRSVATRHAPRERVRAARACLEVCVRLRAQLDLDFRSAFKARAVKARVVEDVAQRASHGLVLRALRLGQARTHVAVEKTCHDPTETSTGPLQRQCSAGVSAGTPRSLLRRRYSLARTLKQSGARSGVVLSAGGPSRELDRRWRGGTRPRRAPLSFSCARPCRHWWWCLARCAAPAVRRSAPARSAATCSCRRPATPLPRSLLRLPRPRAAACSWRCGARACFAARRCSTASHKACAGPMRRVRRAPLQPVWPPHPCARCASWRCLVASGA